jgi:integrase
MSRPPRRVKKRSSATRAAYYHAGRVHLKRAVSRFPGICRLQAIVSDVEIPLPDGDPVLRPATTRRYLEDYKVIVSVLVRVARQAEDPRQDAPIMERIEAALLSRRGRPTTPRGSSRRVMNATALEAGLSFSRLKTLAVRNRSMSAAGAALYLLVEPRIGLRPIEYCGATIDGSILVIENAKRADGQDLVRRIDLSAYPETVLSAIRALISLMPATDNAHVFKLWRNTIASSLARASLVAGGRRLSLYSFRHIALATWEKNGFSAAEIALLAGHLSLHTARSHYARAGSGWDVKELPQPGHAPAHATDRQPERNSDVGLGSDPSDMSDSDPAFDFTPIPEPVARPATIGGTKGGAEIWQAYIERLNGPGQQIARAAQSEPGTRPILGHQSPTDKKL